ncbi:uncharacterized protein LOC136034261 [Artemia franciscana]|uniref:uncharacterized protein LOC136034261 n=1 Tax=Artemia franciscana TaxID=6661 RepID=UPI0032DA41E5
MSHCYLMIKLSVYQIENDVAQWIHRFLSDRIQIIIVYDERGDHIYSTPVHIKSGVPKGNKLGPTLFNLCVDDAPEVVKNGFELCADDSKLFGPAASTKSCSSLQTTWILKFNPCECKVLYLGLNNPYHTYYMVDSAGANRPIQSAKEECDLGVIIDNKLKFHSHCQNQVAKANNILGLIKHSVKSHQPRVIEKLYTSLVCHHPEFGMSVASLACQLPAHTLSVTWRYLRRCSVEQQISLFFQKTNFLQAMIKKA